MRRVAREVVLRRQRAAPRERATTHQTLKHADEGAALRLLLLPTSRIICSLRAVNRGRREGARKEGSWSGCGAMP